LIRGDGAFAVFILEASDETGILQPTLTRRWQLRKTFFQCHVCRPKKKDPEKFQGGPCLGMLEMEVERVFGWRVWGYAGFKNV